MKGAKSNAAIFRWPLLIAALTAAGLLSALVGDEAWDALSWALLAVPVGLCGYFSFARR
ncbi:hypothetical protein [Methyloversatilis discipulorum]|uniref:hypothetical protein n=1 Tax=Methyloversatilis discipulorum TaxID=1119528 RepID=UPI003AF6B24F